MCASVPDRLAWVFQADMYRRIACRSGSLGCGLVRTERNEFWYVALLPQDEPLSDLPERLASSVMRQVQFQLRNSKEVAAVLGDGVRLADNWWGE